MNDLQKIAMEEKLLWQEGVVVEVLKCEGEDLVEVVLNKDVVEEALEEGREARQGYIDMLSQNQVQCLKFELI